MAWTYSAYYIIFSQVRESYEDKGAKITLFFYPLVCRKKKAPVFIWPYIDFSSSHRSSKPLLPPFLPQRRLSDNLAFSAKVSFKGKKKIPDDHNGL